MPFSMAFARSKIQIAFFVNVFFLFKGMTLKITPLCFSEGKIRADPVLGNARQWVPMSPGESDRLNRNPGIV